jgi:hypothetical protein
MVGIRRQYMMWNCVQQRSRLLTTEASGTHRKRRNG